MSKGGKSWRETYTTLSCPVGYSTTLQYHNNETMVVSEGQLTL